MNGPAPRGRPVAGEIEREVASEGMEQGLEKASERITKTEIKTVEDMGSTLREIELVIERDRNALPRKERERIAGLLDQISRKEHLIESALRKLKAIFSRIGTLDSTEIQELEARMTRAEGKEKGLLRADLEREREKLELEKALLGFQSRQDTYLESFKSLLGQAVEHISRSPYPVQGCS